MKLVELCVLLEDLATELNFEFDWQSEKAMSKWICFWVQRQFQRIY